MSTKYTEPESPVVFLKNEFARQRWELFHRAIAHAKQSNETALGEAEAGPGEARKARPALSIIR